MAKVAAIPPTVAMSMAFMKIQTWPPAPVPSDSTKSRAAKQQSGESDFLRETVFPSDPRQSNVLGDTIDTLQKPWAIRQLQAVLTIVAVGFAAGATGGGDPQAESPSGLAAGLVGHWKLRGDCHDSSGSGLPGINHGDDRRVSFSIDDADQGTWEDCGRPSPTSNYVGNCLTVFRGNLYASTFDGPEETDWCHVYRHAGGKQWIDCGRVGAGKTAGVMSMIVHQGQLYAGTCTYDWTRVYSGDYDLGRVYRYAGGTTWEDCGQPGEMRRIMCMATYGGRLYVGGDRGVPRPGEKQFTGRPYRIYRHEGGTEWSVAFEFPTDPARNCFPHAMAVHDGRLFVGFPHVWTFDGTAWTFAGTPLGDTPADKIRDLQVHCLEVSRGRLLAGMWPEGRVVAYRSGESWDDMGLLGDSTEIMALSVYNGSLYGAAIPRAEIFRYDGDRRWTSLRRFFSPPGWDPGPALGPAREEVNNWSRITALTTAGPLKIGFGEQDYFTGLIRDVRLYRRGLDENEIAAVRAIDPPAGSRSQ
jgi:hypothetical protein